jgi:hypothetical protein
VDHLLRAGKGDTAQLQSDAAAYGVILESHHLAPAHYTLWLELWPAVQLFMRCLTQWRATSGGIIGLDYGVMLQLAAVLQLPVTQQLLDDVQTMEAHAITKVNRRK